MINIDNIDLDKLPTEVYNILIQEFQKLTLKEKLVVYAKLNNGTSFRVHSNDLFNITKHNNNKIFNDFVENIKSSINET